MITKKSVFNRFHTIGLAIAVLSLAGCAKELKKEDMSFDELKKNAFAYIKTNKHEEAIGYLEHITTQHADNEKIAQIKLLLAEEYFKSENYPSAAIAYESFHEFYPSNKHAEYAKYRGLLSKFYLTLNADCDQSETEHALRSCNEYLETPAYTKYCSDVRDIKQSCEHKLINKEVYVFDFYLKQEQFEAAQKRLAFLRKTYLPLSASLEPQIMYLECKLANKQKDQTTLKKQLTALAGKYPESEFTQMASALTTRTPFFF